MRFEDLPPEQQEAVKKQYAEHLAAQAEQQRLQALRVQAARQAAARQVDIDNFPRRRYAVIAAIDQHGGFAKDGKIPWHYPEDFKWFKSKTKGHVCVMGRNTYEDIMARKLVPSDGGSSQVVLPDRRCFVVSSGAKDVPGAVVVRDILDVENHLAEEDYDKTIFIIGGERLFREGIALAHTVYLTLINKDFECDKHFPTKYLEEYFSKAKMYKHDSAPDLRFTVWTRNDERRRNTNVQNA